MGGTIIRIAIGIFIVAVGAGMVIRTRSFIDIFGSIEWAETKMGFGGSNLLYKIIGLAVCFVGFLVASNLWDEFLQGTLGSILGLG